ncbi:peptide chain release factor N(5)-glutamine methyltransferase [Candidatus Saccharibacteria bacterium]|nr:MAG: peptide chain release factor N(5)-glutamine methyltransferase [Candidatus Saccharibacteria bacterium]
MSENLSPVAPTTISTWLQTATNELQSVSISSARLDCLILLGEVLGEDKTYLLAYPDRELSDRELSQLMDLLKRRKQHEPIAYIRGFTEFYGRRFRVTPDVLIPRPETEVLIDLLKELPLVPTDSASSPPLLIDVGTGSGCIGITAGLELPELRILLTDIDPRAIEVAMENAAELRTSNVTTGLSNLLANVDTKDQAYIITANLPYVAKGFEISPDARHEPDLALFADDQGYALIEQLLPQAQEQLRAGGYLLLESDPWQHDRILKNATEYGFSPIAQQRFHLVLQKAV